MEPEAIHFIQDLAVILAVAGPVAWICQRIGLSVVVGFIAAGIVVGPHAPWISVVDDVERIQVLAQVGLVFLMFGIGLELSVRRLRRLGIGLLLAVSAYALLIYFFVRLLILGLGWSSTEGLFLAGMLMISSSSIIGKILKETGATHERPGQMALGALVVEDVIAVLMLTLLGSVVQFGGAGAEGGTSLLAAVGRLGAFVVLMGVVGLLLVPWLLKRMSIAADEELQTLGMAGLLFALAIVAQRAGYSLALGAILLGAIVAETPHRVQIERIFEGMRDVFSAVFFVAIGMQIDLSILADSALLILGLTVFTLLLRGTAVTAGLSLIGTPPQDALRTGLTMTPIGEFSFIIAQLGVAAAVVPERFYPMAVGVSLLTTLLAPVLTRRSERISEALLRRQPRWLRDWQTYYHDWLERLHARSKRNLFWQLSRRRIIQVSAGLLFISGLIVFSRNLLGLMVGWLGPNWLFPNGPSVIFWTLLVLATLTPLVAVWRNLSAMAMLYAEMTTRGNEKARRFQPVVETGLKVAAAAALFLWLMSILPVEGTARWLLGLSVLVAVIALLVLRRKMIYWHSELEVEILGMFESEANVMTSTSAPWLQPHGDWKLNVVDCVLPDLADCQGKSIRSLQLRSRFGCTVVGVERHGYMIPLPGPDAVLYPRDKVLLMGNAEQIRNGKRFLGSVSGTPEAHSVFEEVSMEALAIPAGSPAAGRTLADLAPSQTHGVLIAGIRRGETRTLNPDAGERIDVGDDVLALGTPEQIRNFKAWLREAENGG